jgi:hypothetical protein
VPIAEMQQWRRFQAAEEFGIVPGWEKYDVVGNVIADSTILSPLRVQLRVKMAKQFFSGPRSTRRRRLPAPTTIFNEDSGTHNYLKIQKNLLTKLR